MSSLIALPGSEPHIGFPFSSLGGMAGVISSYSTTSSFDAANDSICVVFEAPKTGDLFGFEFHLQAGFTGTLRCGFVDLSGGGQFPGTTPTFSHYSDITNPSSGWQGPASYMGASGGGSGAKKSVVKGEMVCLCISSQAWSSGTGTITLWNMNTTAAPWRGNPYTGVSNAGAAWGGIFDFPFLSLYYDNAGSKEAAATPIHPAIQPWNNTITTLTIDSANPKMAGLKFRFPMEVAIDGATVYIDNDVDVTPRLVKTGTTTNLITTALMDKDWRLVSGAHSPISLRFADVTIEANTWYRLLFENSASATNCGFYSYDCNDAGDMAAAGAGADFHLTQSDTAFSSLTGTDGTDYTDTTTSCPLVALRLSKVHDGVGGGGGGMRLAGHGGLAA